MPNPTPERDAQYARLHTAHAARAAAQEAHYAAVHEFRLAVLDIDLKNGDLAAELGVVYNTAKDMNMSASQLAAGAEATHPRRGKNRSAKDKAAKAAAKAAAAQAAEADVPDSDPADAETFATPVDATV